MSLVVTAAASPLGRAVAEALAARKSSAPLVLVDAEPQRIDPGLRGRAEIRHGDLHDPLTLGSAFAGAQTLLLPGAAQGAALQGLGNALEAARGAGVERIVLLSSIAPEPGNPGPWADHDRAAEALVRSAGMGWSILRLQEELEALVEAGRRQGPDRMFDNRATGQSAPIARTDAAAAIAAVMADPSLGGRTLHLTGPGLIGSTEIAAALGMSYTAHKDFKYLEQLRRDGLSALEAESAMLLGRAVRSGYYAVATDEVKQLAGREPHGLEELLRP